jgi:predicted membrane-bound spermidine synthase
MPAAMLVGIAFFMSGAASLVYQVAWQRILALHSGVGIYSIAIIVAAFMAGLGLGSYWGGLLSARLTPRGALLAFGALELAVAVVGRLSVPLYYDLLYLRFPALYASLWRTALVHAACLLPPTCLMGMSLPFLARTMVRDAAAAGPIGRLYAVNVLGASAGAALTPWVLVRLLGIRGAVSAAAAANLTAGLVALACARGLSSTDEARGLEPAATASAPASRGRGLALWLALYAMSGFCALSLEIVWFRLLDVAVRSTAFTFGTVLALYLLGLAVGSLAASRGGHEPDAALVRFLTLQCFILAYSALAVGALVRLPAATPVFSWLVQFWRGSGSMPLVGNPDHAGLLRLYLALPLFLFGLPTALMGASFPTLQRAVQDDPRTSGLKVGLLQAANITGCVTGSLLVGLYALSWLGTTGSLRALAVCGLVFAAIGLRRRPGRFGLLAALLLVAAVSVPGQRRLWLLLHGTTAAPARIEEDATGVAAVVPRGRDWVVFVNGKSHSWLPFGGVHTRLGAISAAVHAAPVEVAIVGLGSGNTAWAAACRPETRDVQVFEICAPQERLLRHLAEDEDVADARRLFADPRLHVVAADGRAALALGTRRYDVIEADALWPEVAYAGNLYSEEFFTLCARRLKPGGVVCTWAPTPRVAATFARVFPYILRSGGHTILVGSYDPLPYDRPTWVERLLSPAVSDYLGPKGVADALELARDLRPWKDRGRRFPESTANFDLFPRDEFLSH